MVHNTTTPDIETASEDYRNRFQGTVGAYFLRVQEEAVSRSLTLLGKDPLKILEVGGGHGQITESLLRAGHEVWVQGSANECFERLRPLATKFPGKLDFICSPLWTIPALDRSFDAVIALRLLAHVERWQELLAEMARLARRGVIVDFPSRRALNVLAPMLFGIKKRIEGNTRPYFNYSKGQLSEELWRLDLRSKAGIGQFFFPMGVHRAIGRANISRSLEFCARALGLSTTFGSPVILTAVRPSPEVSETSGGGAGRTVI